jgi:hypothetical protein
MSNDIYAEKAVPRTRRAAAAKKPAAKKTFPASTPRRRKARPITPSEVVTWVHRGRAYTP